MGKKRALARLCEVFSLDEMLDLCREIRLKQDDIRLIEQRFYEGESRELCDMPVGVQRKRVPIIEIYLVNAVIKRKDRMTSYQRDRLNASLSNAGIFPT
jgi:hypothetical protein